jgi:TonB dependent receptor
MARFYPVLVSGAVLVSPFASAAIHAQTAAATTRERPALGSTITVGALADLPASANALSLLDAAQADLISDRLDTGGLSTADPARMGAHGSTWTQTRFRIGPADITDPDGGGSPLLLPSLHLWDRVDVATGLIPLDSNAPGLAVTFEPRRPGRTWTRTIDASFSPPGLLARREATNPPAIARLHAWNYGDLFLGGPIVPGRLGLVIAGDWTRSSKFERDDPTRLDARVASGFAHLEATPSDRDDVRTVVWVQRARSPFANRNAFGEPAAADRRTAVHLQSVWERRVGDELSWSAFGSYTRRSREPETAAAPSIAIERLRDGPVPSLLNPRAGTDAVWSAGTRATLPAMIMFGRRHTAQVGVELSGGMETTHAGFSGIIGELVNGLPARVWSYADNGRDSRWRKTTVAAYASDRFELTPRVLLDGAIRFESTGGSAQDNANAVRWNDFLPRGSFRWEITEAAGLAAFVGYGRYGYELPLQYFAYGDPNAQVGSVYRWTMTGAPHAPRTNEIGELISRVGPGTGGNPQFSAIDPSLKRPYMDEIVMGFESRPRPSTVFRLAALARLERHLVGVMDVGVPIASYSVSYIPDHGVDLVGSEDDYPLPVYNRQRASFGADRYLLTNPADDRATFVGVDATGQTTINHLFLLFGATAGRSEGLSGNRGFQAIENDQGILGELFTDPNAATYAKGRLFTERGYTIKTAFVYQFPYDVRLGAVARYQDGQHFARLVIVPNLNQGPEAIRAFADGRTRFTFSGTLDARLQKGFAMGGARVDAILDGYNLLNMAKEVEEFPVTGPTSRLTAAVQPPRALHVGIRVTF